MALDAKILTQLLALEARGSLCQATFQLPPPLALPDLQALAARAAALTPSPAVLRLAVVRTYTSELLQPWLDACAALHGVALETHHAPYGSVLQEAHEGSSVVAHRPDMTLLLLQRTDPHPALGQPVAGLAPEAARALRKQALDHLKGIVARFRALPVGRLVLGLLPSMHGPALGLHDAQADRGELRFWQGLQTELADWLRDEVPSSTWLDLEDLVAEVGRRRALDARHWLSSRYPFTSEASLELARRVVALGRLLKAPPAKVIVLDADNTLWGGVVGEDGPDGIALGPDYPGNAYLAFQRRLLDLQQRGFVLALCSKNNAADVDQVLREHPHQLLKAEHFVARRVNWEPKPDNLVSMAAELNLGLESFVFVDDSDHECAAVRARLPQVEVIQVPARPHEVPRCLDRVARLEVLGVTAEDRAKTAMYDAERRRRELLEGAPDVQGDPDAHLARLGMRMRVSVGERRHVPRLAQLTQKTNQFNLTTRRYTEQQVAALIESPEWLVADFSLADAFGDAGIVGLALVRFGAPGEADFDTLLMSCRVIGRKAEDAFVHTLLRELQRRGVARVSARYVPTPKNVLVQDLLPRLGFVPESDGGDPHAPRAPERRYRRDLHLHPPADEAAFPIAVEWAAPATA